MVTKEEFIDLIKRHCAWEKRIDSVQEILNCNIFEADWVEYANHLFDKALKISFSESAVDTVMWWIYEHTDKEKEAMWDENGKVIPMKTVEDLWNFVKEERK